MTQTSILLQTNIINELLYALLYDAGSEQVECTAAVGDANRGLANSRLVPAWNHNIDNNLKLLVADLFTQIATWGDILLAHGANARVAYELGINSPAAALRYLLSKGVDFGDARHCVSYIEWVVNGRRPVDPEQQLTDEQENEIYDEIKDIRLIVDGTGELTECS